MPNNIKTTTHDRLTIIYYCDVASAVVHHTTRHSIDRYTLYLQIKRRQNITLDIHGKPFKSLDEAINFVAGYMEAA